MKKAQARKKNDAADKSDRNEFLIVGLGASAGGISALKEFFEHVPADSGMAYVVILHLSPDHESRLAAVLQTVAWIPVTQVTEKVDVKPNHAYVIPPNQHLEVRDGGITVTPNTTLEERRAPVDIFFRTLAESHGARAVAVVLSGTGANGSMGLKRIRERDGAAFVQNPREAEFSEMPRNSIATDLVDDILPVAEIPAKIIAYKESLGTVAIPVEAEARAEEQQQALREIFTQLRPRTGHDFSNYKRPTLLRRIERRINIHNLPDLPAYSAFCQQRPEETQERVMETLHFALNPGGYLFLGASESVDGAGDFYAPVSREHHIFQSRQAAARAYPVPETVPSFRLEKSRAADLLDAEKRARERVTYGDLHQRLLEQYAPPSVVVNEEYDIVHLSERAGR